MLDHTAALERIETAQRETPFCWCAAPTLPVERGRVIWLGCSSLDQPKGLLRRLLSLGVDHTHHPIVDLSELDAAAGPAAASA